MRVYAVLTLLHLLSVVFGDTFTVTEGEDVTVKCTFKLPGSTKIFCKNNCDTNDILVTTTENSARNGRYRIRYFPEILNNIISVSIEKVQLSDAGRYRCRLERDRFFNGNENFEIKVIKGITPKTTVTPTDSPGPDPDPSPGPNPDPSPGPSPDPSPGPSPDPSPGPSPDPSPGLSPDPSPSPGSGETSGTSGPLDESHTASGSLLYVGLTLAVVVVIFTGTLLILYKKKNNKNKAKDSSYNPEPAVSEVSEVNREYEEIPEQQVQNRPTSGIYSLASASAHTQVDTVLYSEVSFHGKSAPRSPTEEVIYSTVRKEEALYSNVSKRQQS